MWFAAHVVMLFKPQSGTQELHYFHENVILIEATSVDEAFERAQAIGREAEMDSSGTEVCGTPTRYVFAGLRKIVECQGPTRYDGSELTTGTEVTYTTMKLYSAAEFERY